MHRFRLATTLMVLLLSFQAVRGVQHESDTTDRLSLGFDKSDPGNQAFIGIIFSTQGEVAIGRIVAEITFPRQLLSFEEARAGLPIKAINAELSAEVRNDDSNSENSVLEVVIASTTGAAIPAGILANLTFTLLPEAPTQHIIELKNKAEAFTTDDPPEPVELSTTNGEIESLSTPALFACFFYMH
jgi:hypothetical protein